MSGLSFVPVDLNNEAALKLCATMRAETYAVSGRESRYFHERWPSLEEYKIYLSKHSKIDSRYVTLAYENEGVVGHILVDNHKDLLNTGYIEIIYIKQEYRGRRLGEKLMAYVEDIFRQQGFAHVRLTSHIHTPALTNFYTSCGYNQLGLVDDKLPALMLWEKQLNA